MEHIDIDVAGDLSNVKIVVSGNLVGSPEWIGRRRCHDNVLSFSFVVVHEMGVHRALVISGQTWEPVEKTWYADCSRCEGNALKWQNNYDKADADERLWDRNFRSPR